MTINRITFFGILLCIMTFNLSAQTTEKVDTTKVLIGQWVFVKTLDANNNEVKYVTQDYKGPDGSDILSWSGKIGQAKVGTLPNHDHEEELQETHCRIQDQSSA